MKFLTQILLLAMFKRGSGFGQSDTRLVYHGDSKEIQCRDNTSCPTWFTCNSQNNCQCGNGHDGIIACDDQKKTSAVLDCHCVTYDNDTRSTFTGSCFYNCENHYTEDNDLVYYTLPKKAEMLINKSVCTNFNRKGLLCGDCEDGHSPLVLSYNLSCVECPDGHKNWWKFTLAALVPLTFFYFFVVLFNINVTTSRLHGVVWFSQAVSTPTMIRLMMSAFAQKKNPTLLSSARIIMTFYSFWNLEIFHSVIPNICLNITTLQALALGYVVALYPFLLILISYIFIKLYDRECSCIVIMWKPFYKFLAFFKSSWDIHTSVIDSFATFFILSYMKVLCVSFDLLVPTQIYKLGSNRSTLGLYYSPSVVYFGDEHFPYGITAVLIFTLVVPIPTIIFFVYPFQFFQKCISVFPFNWHFLHAFVDSFQGCYKDGTEPGTFDCRWFSAVMLLTRFLLFVVYGLTLSMMYFIYATIILGVLLITIINVQPFKKVVVRYPSTDSIFFIFFNIFYICYIGRSVASINNDIYYTLLTPVLLLATGLTPLVYISFLICSWLLSRSKWISVFKVRFANQ